jgi:hypothetical protein
MTLLGALGTWPVRHRRERARLLAEDEELGVRQRFLEQGRGGTVPAAARARGQRTRLTSGGRWTTLRPVVPQELD